tara:strand:+ start:556 stop:747 length:192 start_codon:yes stop_codon:yes gene_type:complete
MYYITILDFANGSVDQYNLADHFDKTTLAHWQAEDFEEFITSEGYRLNNIEWMSHSDNTINKF